MFVSSALKMRPHYRRNDRTASSRSNPSSLPSLLSRWSWMRLNRTLLLEGLTISQGTRAVSDSFYMMKRARLLELSPDQRATCRRRVIDFNLPALDNSQAVLSPLSAERHQSSDP